MLYIEIAHGLGGRQPPRLFREGRNLTPHAIGPGSTENVTPVPSHAEGSAVSLVDPLGLLPSIPEHVLSAARTRLLYGELVYNHKLTVPDIA